MMIATLIVIFGILWLGKSNIFVRGLHVSILVNNANGISVGDEVFYSGIKVGTITSTDIAPAGVVLNAKIERIKDIPVDSKFFITDYSMIGGKILEIEPGKSKQFIHSGDLVKGSVSPGLGDAITNLTDLSPKIDKLLDNLNNLSGEKTLNNLNSTFTDLGKSIKDIRKIINGDLKSTMKDLSDFTSQNKDKLSLLIDSLGKNSVQLQQFLKKSTSASSKLDELLNRINKGEGSLGKLAQNDSLYDNMNKTIISIDSLINDIKKNPKKYLEIKVL
jgi:phospholipid/cholesterol/gamma-HCH transport system substrate-binding protein